MKKWLPLLLFLNMLALFAAAQSPVVIGIVLDADTKEPLIGVSVFSEDSVGTITDSAGKYQLQVKTGEHNLTFKYLGYSPFQRKVNLKPAEALIVNVALKSNSNEMNTVVVSASKFSQQLNEVVVSMGIISESLVQNSNKLGLEDAMEQMPGVTVIDGQANIRGGSGFSYGAGSRVLVMVDEMPLLSADANDVKWSFLPIESMSQTEVIKGASSALYGSSALNGIMNMRTKYATDKPVTMVEMYVGAYDIPAYQQWYESKESHLLSSVNFNHAQKFGNLDLVIGGQVFNDDGYRQEETEQRIRGNVSLRYRFKKAEGLSVTFRTNVQQAKGGLFFIWANDTSGALMPLGGLDTATTTISYYTTTRNYIDNEWLYLSKNGFSHKLKGRYFFTGNVNNTNQAAEGRVYYTEYQFQKLFANLVTVTAGAVNQYNTVKSQLYGDHTSRNSALYAQGDLKYKAVVFSLGGRLENNRIDDVKDNVTPVFRTGVNYGLFKATHFRASYGQGYRFPSIAEKFVQTNIGSIAIYPNDSIQSESGWSAEVGMQQGFQISNWKGYFDAAYFINRYSDMMEFAFGSYGPPSPPLFGLGFKSVNVGNTQIKGIDLTLAGDGNFGFIPVRVLIGYTFIDPIATDFNPAVDTLYNSSNENVLKYRYGQMFKSDVQFGIGKFGAGFSTRFLSHMENIDQAFVLFIPGVAHYRQENTTGDWVFDARISFSPDKNINMAFITKNIFNHLYVTRPADVQPVRTFTFQVILNY